MKDSVFPYWPRMVKAKHPKAEPAQSVVELALLVPIFLFVLLVILDVGRGFFAWIALHNAAREGAHFASTKLVGGTSDAAIRGIVAAEARGVSILADATHVAIAYPSPDVVQLTARSRYLFFMPLASSIMGEGGTWLSARAAFPLMVPTPTPLPITPSTPVPTPTPTPTPPATPTATAPPTATGTATPSPTPTPTPTPGPCTVSVAVPVLSNGTGYYVTFTTAGSGTISATWPVPALGAARRIQLLVYSGNPFAGEPNPTSLAPPAGSLASGSGTVTSLTVTTASVAAGSYSVYFYKSTTGAALSGSTTGSVTYVKATCP